MRLIYSVKRTNRCLSFISRSECVWEAVLSSVSSTTAHSLTQNGLQPFKSRWSHSQKYLWQDSLLLLNSLYGSGRLRLFEGQVRNNKKGALRRNFTMFWPCFISYSILILLAYQMLVCFFVSIQGSVCGPLCIYECAENPWARYLHLTDFDTGVVCSVFFCLFYECNDTVLMRRALQVIPQKLNITLHCYWEKQFPVQTADIMSLLNQLHARVWNPRSHHRVTLRERTQHVLPLFNQGG